MKDTFNGWQATESMSLDSIVNLIVTGKTAKEAKPDSWIFTTIGDSTESLRVLDFGCGVGRNTFAMANYAPMWQVHGYDNEQMLLRAREYYSLHYTGSYPSNIYFSDNWNLIKSYHFDTILCNLVLQHIMEQDIATYVKDFKPMADRLVVTGRRFNDDKDGRSTWTILAEQGLIPTEFYIGNQKIPFQPEGDPHEHNWAIYIL